MPTKIKQLLPTDGAYHLVIHDSEVDGTTLLRIACWAIVSKHGDDDQVLPMVVQPYTHRAELVFYPVDDTDVVGISVPGDSEATWHDIASSIRGEQKELDDREERESEAKELVEEMPEIERKMVRQALRVVREESSGEALKREDLSGVARSQALILLTERQLASCDGKDHQGRPQWHVSPLGRAVLERLDKHVL